MNKIKEAMITSHRLFNLFNQIITIFRILVILRCQHSILNHLFNSF